ncbi:MAG TPA: hypothetical protein VM912_21070 [Terriglobales bacterium]|nr:hypothetical protein [Terriglobales bacterium]
MADDDLQALQGQMEANLTNAGTPRPDMLPNDAPSGEIDLSQLSPQNQQALSDVLSTPSAQPRSTVSQSALGSDQMPGVVRLIAGMINPQTQQTQGSLRPPSRLDVFEQFLGNFATALASGLQTKPGPGANARAAGAAIMGPTMFRQQQAAIDSEIQARQAQSAEAQSRAAMTQEQTRMLGTNIPVTLPNGQQLFIPASQVGQFMKGGYAAQVNAAAKLTSEQLKAQIQAGQVARVLPGQDASGNLVMNAYDKQGKLLGTVPGALPPSSYLPTATSTTQYMQDGSGSIVAVPKTTTTSKVPPTLAQKVPALGNAAQSVPGSTTQLPRSGFPRPGSRGAVTIQARPVLGPDAQPLQGKAASDPVYAYDPQSDKTILTNRSDALSRGLQGIRTVKESDIRADMHDTRVLNDVAIKSNAVIDSADALDQGLYQSGVIANALAAAEKDNQFRVGISNTNVPMSAINDMLKAEGFLGQAGMSQKSRDYVVSVLSLRESAMGLQKVLTGSARSNEQQIQALQATIPGLETDSALARQKLGAFTQNLSMLREGLPELPGVKTVPIKEISQPQPRSQGRVNSVPSNRFSQMFFQ